MTLKSNYIIRKLNLSQKLVGDAVRIGKDIPYIHSLSVLDVTAARKILRQYRRKTGEPVSLTSYILYCCAQAIKQDISIQQMLGWNNKLVAHNDIDFFFPSEKAGDENEIQSFILRDLGSKSLREIAQLLNKKLSSSPKKPDLAQRMFMKLPWFIRKRFIKLWMMNPHTRKKYFGTVYFSSILNVSDSRKSWGIPIPMQSLGIFIGTLNRVLVQTDSGVETKDNVQITLSVDHRVNNGLNIGTFGKNLLDILNSQTLEDILEK